MTAIRLAKAMGAAVTTAGSDAKCEACLALGADHAINYRSNPISLPRSKRLTDGRGVDVVLDMAGDYVAHEIDCLAEDGRLVIIAVQGGVKSRSMPGRCCAAA